MSPTHPSQQADTGYRVRKAHLVSYSRRAGECCMFQQHPTSHPSTSLSPSVIPSWMVNSSRFLSFIYSTDSFLFIKVKNSLWLDGAQSKDRIGTSIPHWCARVSCACLAASPSRVHTHTHRCPASDPLHANPTTSVLCLFCAVVLTDLWAWCEEVWSADPLKLETSHNLWAP